MKGLTSRRCHTATKLLQGNSKSEEVEKEKTENGEKSTPRFLARGKKVGRLVLEKKTLNLEGLSHTAVRRRTKKLARETIEVYQRSLYFSVIGRGMGTRWREGGA